jgi:hypothetical protein
MNRRRFFKNAGVGSAALASLPILTHTLATPVRADDDNGLGFRFVSVSKAATVGVVDHRMLMNGCGKFNGSEAQGGGTYDHIDNASPVPKTILDAGRWKAGRILSFSLTGTYGEIAAGILEMEVKLLQEFPSRAVIPATLKVVCSIGAAGLDSGEEGFTLTIPGAPFGPFEPFFVAPGFTFGISVFTLSKHEGD